MTVKTRITLFIVGAGFIASLLFSVVVFLESVEQPIEILDNILECIFYSLLAGFIIFLVRILTRNTWAAVATLFLFFATLILATSGELSFISAAPLLLTTGIIIFVWFRLGFLALTVGLFSFSLLFILPITWQFSAFYSWMGLTGLVLMLAFTLFAFRTSLGGRPIFDTPRLDE